MHRWEEDEGANVCELGRIRRERRGWRDGRLSRCSSKAIGGRTWAQGGVGRAVLNARTFVVATAGAAVDTVHSGGADDGHAAGNVHASLAGARSRWLSVACAEGDDGMTSCPVWDERQGKSWAGDWA